MPTYFLNSMLNRHEMIAIGIENGIIDEKIFRWLWGDRFVKDWFECRDAAFRRRAIRHEPRLYDQFERLPLSGKKRAPNREFLGVAQLSLEPRLGLATDPIWSDKKIRAEISHQRRD